MERAQWYFQSRALGSANSKSAAQIEADLDLPKSKDHRATRIVIHDLRTTAGLAIVALSREGGYFLFNPEIPEDVEKAEHFVREQNHRKTEIESIICPVRNILNNLDIPLLLDVK
jgi:hypothetical protein